MTNNLYTCEGCAFSFDAMHTDADGSLSCPVCENERLRAELAKSRAFADAECAARMETQAEVARLKAERDLARRDLETVMHGAIDGTRAMRDELAESRATVETLTKERDRLKTWVDNHLNEVTDVRGQLDERVAERDTLRADLTLAQAQLAEATAARAALDGQVLALREALGAAKARLIDAAANPRHFEMQAVWLWLGPIDRALATTAQSASDAEARIRADERGKLTATLAIVFGVDKWPDAAERVHENTTKALVEHDARVRREAVEMVAAEADRVKAYGGALTGDVIRALATPPATPHSGTPIARCPKHADGKHQYTPLTCICGSCIGATEYRHPPATPDAGSER